MQSLKLRISLLNAQLPSFLPLSGRNSPFSRLLNTDGSDKYSEKLGKPLPSVLRPFEWPVPEDLEKGWDLLYECHVQQETAELRQL